MIEVPVSARIFSQRSRLVNRKRDTVSGKEMIVRLLAVIVGAVRALAMALLVSSPVALVVVIVVASIPAA